MCVTSPGNPAPELNLKKSPYRKKKEDDDINQKQAFAVKK